MEGGGRITYRVINLCVCRELILRQHAGVRDHGPQPEVMRRVVGQLMLLLAISRLPHLVLGSLALIALLLSLALWSLATQDWHVGFVWLASFSWQPKSQIRILTRPDKLAGARRQMHGPWKDMRFKTYYMQRQLLLGAIPYSASTAATTKDSGRRWKRSSSRWAHTIDVQARRGRVWRP